MLRALRGYQALQVTMLLVVNYFICKACRCTNDRFIDSILSMIDLTGVNSRLMCAKVYQSTMDWHFTACVTLSIKCVGV